jgi:hypothetical protein
MADYDDHEVALPDFFQACFDRRVRASAKVLHRMMLLLEAADCIENEAALFGQIGVGATYKHSQRLSRRWCGLDGGDGLRGWRCFGYFCELPFKFAACHRHDERVAFFADDLVQILAETDSDGARF